MADDIGIRITTRGSRQSAREADRVSRSVGGIGSSARRSSGGMRLFGRATASAAGGLRLMAGAAFYGAGAIGAGLLIELKRSTDAWQESRKITAQTGAVIRSTGGSANLTAAQIGILATSLSRKTGIDDETIQSGENMLLTFTNIRNEVGKGNNIFTRSTGVLADMSAALGVDMSKSAIQLGKALNDPVKGITALRRVGVTFTDQQQKQIGTLVKTGDTLGAQRIILHELNKEFGGSAAAQATPIDRLKVSWGNVEEAIGKGVSPAVDAMATKLDRFFVRAEPDITQLGDRLGKVFGRKDLSLGEKLKLGGQDVQRTFRPYANELRAQIERMDLGTKLGDAFDAAAPRMADAAGRAAPRVASSFVSAFLATGLYGKMFTLGLMASKLGVFSAFGRLAADRFVGRFGRTAGPQVATTVGTEMAASNAAGRFGGLGSKYGRIFGRAAGIAAGAYLAVLVAREASKILAGTPVDLAGASVGAKTAADTDPTVRATRNLTGQPSKRQQFGRWERQHPALARRLRAGTATPGELRASGDPLIPGAVHQSHRTRTKARGASAQPIHVHTTVKLQNNRELARAVHQVNADDRARR